MISAAYGAMITSVSALGRAPNRSESWVSSIAVNLCDLIISWVVLASTLYFTEGIYALEEFMMVFSDLSTAVFIVSVGGVLLLQTVLCLLVFGWAARRYLMNRQVEKTKAGA